jgi:hypothetical protein
LDVTSFESMKTMGSPASRLLLSMKRETKIALLAGVPRSKTSPD